MFIDDELPSLDEASSSVDALVADDDDMNLPTNQQTLCSLESFILPLPTQSGHQSIGLGGFPIPSISAPPGLAFGPGNIYGTGQIIPMQPILPATPTMSVATPPGLRSATGSPAPRSAPAGPKQEASKKALNKAEAKSKVRALAIDSGLSRDIASQSSASKGKAILQEEDFPTLDSLKSGAQQATSQSSAKAHQVPTPKPVFATPKKSQQEPVVASPAKPEKTRRAAEKRPPKNTLNIAAATTAKMAQSKPVETITPIEKPMVDTSESSPATGTGTPSSTIPTSDIRPGTPASGAGPSTASSLSRAGPKTLRLVSTPGIASAGSAIPGLLSMAGRVVRPGTPTSEMFSDSASLVSPSIPPSRVGSPPPVPASKIVGSAAVRTTTKSQQRKQRKEAHKGMTEAIVEAAKSEVEVHAPVVGRKKKQKKEKPAKAAAKVPAKVTKVDGGESSSGVAEERDSKPATTAKDVNSAKEEEKPSTTPPVAATMSPVKKGKENKKAKGKSKEAVAPVPEPAPPQPEPTLPEPERPFDKLQPTPDSVFRRLVRDGLNPHKISMLRPFNSHAIRLEASAMASKTGGNIGSPHDPKQFCKDFVSNHEEIVLRAGKPIRRMENGQRVLITPHGDVVRGLTEEEEDHYLILQNRVAKHANDPVAYKNDQHRVPSGDFSIIQGRMVANGPPSFFPQGEDDIPKSYNSKIRREEAISFANQFAMPSMRLGNRTFVGEKWRDQLEDDNTAEVMYRLKAMFYDQKPSDSQKQPRVGALFQPIFDGSKQDEAAAREKEEPKPLVETTDETVPTQARGSPSPSMSRKNLFADEVDENPINDEHLPRYGLEGRDTSTPRPAPPLTFEELEKAFFSSKKEVEKYEKMLNTVIRKNRRILLGQNH